MRRAEQQLGPRETAPVAVVATRRGPTNPATNSAASVTSGIHELAMRLRAGVLSA